MPWTSSSMDLRRSSDMEAPVKATVLSAVDIADVPVASELAIWSLRAMVFASLIVQRVGRSSPQFISIALRYSRGIAHLNLMKYSLSLFPLSGSNLSTARCMRVARECKLSLPSHEMVPRRASQLYLSSGLTKSFFNSALMSSQSAAETFL